MTSPSQIDTDPNSTGTADNADIKADAAELDRRIERWEREFRPRNDAERSYLRDAATLAWQIERIGREVALAAFEPSPEAEKLRRFLMSLRRESRMTMDAFWKARKQGAKLLEPAEG